MNTHYKYLIYFFNYHGILSLKSKNNKLTVSNVLVLLNFLLIPFASVLFLSLYPILYEKILDPNVINFEKASVFMINATLVVCVEFYLVTILVVYIQLWNRKKILIFIQSCLKVSEMFKAQLGSKVFKGFEKVCIKKLLVILFIIAVHKVFMHFISTRTITSFFVLIIINWNEHTYLYFIIFCFVIISFFEAAVTSLNEEIETFDEFGRDKKVFYEMILNNLKHLLNLTNQFYNMFGFLFSLATIYLVSVLTVRVRSILSSSKIITFIFSRFIFWLWFFVEYLKQVLSKKFQISYAVRLFYLLFLN